MLCKADPDPQHFGGQDCFTCETRPGQCMRQGALYSITCQECKAAGRESVYFGETGRTLFDRGAEHRDAHRKRNPESILVEHEGEEHGDRVVPWSMVAVGFPRGNLMR